MEFPQKVGQPGRGCGMKKRKRPAGRRCLAAFGYSCGWLDICLKNMYNKQRIAIFFYTRFVNSIIGRAALRGQFNVL
jgi:hypothetical protein